MLQHHSFEVLAFFIIAPVIDAIGIKKKDVAGT
jgi:hypothetical protein